MSHMVQQVADHIALTNDTNHKKVDGTSDATKWVCGRVLTDKGNFSRHKKYCNDA